MEGMLQLLREISNTNSFFVKTGVPKKQQSEMRKTVWTFLKTLKIRLPCDSAGCIYLKKNKLNTNIKRHMHPMFTAALFTIAKM